MSIGWSTIGTTLRQIFSEVAIVRDSSGDDVNSGQPFTAQWVDGKRAWRDGSRLKITDERGYTVGLTITSVSAIGEDESRYEYDEDEQKQTETQTGQRKFTLQVQALTIVNGVNSDWSAAITERVRTRLTSRRIIDRLLGIDVSVISCGPSAPLYHRDGQRMVSSATMDIVFGATASEDDPIPGGWVQYLVISSHLKDGDELPAGMQMVDVEIPTIPEPPEEPDEEDPEDPPEDP